MALPVRPFQIPQMDRADAKPVTFGMEIEFMVPFPDKEADKHETDDERFPQGNPREEMLELEESMHIYHLSILQVAQNMKWGGIKVIADLVADPPEHTENAAKHFGARIYDLIPFGNVSFAILAWDQRDFASYKPLRCFVAKHESHEDLQQESHTGPIPGHFWTCVEINTPVMDAARMNEEMILLSSALTAIRSRTQTWISERCGLHIHAGLRDGVSHDQARAFACFTALLEQDLIMQLTNPYRHRAAGPCPAMTENSRVARTREPPAVSDLDTFGRMCIKGVMDDYFHPPPKSGDRTAIKLRNILAGILFADDLEDLEHSLAAGPLDADQIGRRTALNCSPYKTMELRYPGATTHPRHLRFWADLAKRLMELSQMRPVSISECLRNLYAIVTSRVVLEKEETVRQLLTVLDMQSYINFCLGIMAQYEGMNDDAYIHGDREEFYARMFRDVGIIPARGTITPDGI